MKYKNCGVWEKTIHGVTFKPGEVHEVNGYINAKNFIRVPDDTPITQSVSPSQFKGKRGRPPKESKSSEIKPESKVENSDKPKEEETKQPVSSFNLKEDKKDDDQSKEKE